MIYSCRVEFELKRLCHCCLAHFVNNIQLSPEKGVNSGGYKQRRERSRYISSSLFTDLEGDSCFSVYQISWEKMSLSRNFVYNLQTFQGFCQVHFYYFFCKCSMKIIFYLSVNNDKPKFVAKFYSVLREPIKTRENCYSLFR